MDENMSISNAEMKVMNHIWKTGAMITVPEMLAILNEEGEEGTYRSNIPETFGSEGYLGSNQKGEQALLFSAGKQRTI